MMHAILKSPLNAIGGAHSRVVWRGHGGTLHQGCLAQRRVHESTVMRILPRPQLRPC